MEPAAALVGLMVASMVVTLLVAWRWFGSFRTAFMVMLLVGKVWAAVLWAFGVDKPIFTLTVKNKLTGSSTAFTITATEVIFLSFLATLAFALAWPFLEKELGVRLPW